MRRPIEFADHLKREADRICQLILNSDLPEIDIAIQIDQLRDRCRHEAPDKLELFEVVYVSRFKRLWQQWERPGDRETRPWESPHYGDEDEGAAGGFAGC